MEKFSPRHIVLLAVLALLAILIVFGSASSPLTAEVASPIPTAAAFPPAGVVNPFVCDVTDSTAVAVCHAMILADAHPADDLAAVREAPCSEESGLSADTYACANVNLLSFIPLAQLKASSANDIWGWTDSGTGKEYAIIGLNNGTAFVDISDPINPVLLGKLPSHDKNSIWRDIKVYGNYAYIVADASGAHGLQVFDLTTLRNVESFTTFTETNHYGEFNESHNVIINEDSGFAYAVGIRSGVTCSGGLHMINIQDPINPTFAGCYAADGYIHDAQCVIYNGLDEAYIGREICFNANTDSIGILDVTAKDDLKKIADKTYSNVAYTHQLWLTEDHQFMVVNDELDEYGAPAGKALPKTYIWDISDLDEPFLLSTYTGQVESIDHNLYIHDGYIYQANYQSGLRILDASDISNGKLTEVAYFDTYPNGNTPQFNGAWSNYPFFESGAIVVSSIEQGLFVLELGLPKVDDPVVSYLPLVLKDNSSSE